MTMIIQSIGSKGISEKTYIFRDGKVFSYNDIINLIKNNNEVVSFIGSGPETYGPVTINSDGFLVVATFSGPKKLDELISA